MGALVGGTEGGVGIFFEEANLREELLGLWPGF